MYQTLDCYTGHVSLNDFRTILMYLLTYSQATVILRPDKMLLVKQLNHYLIYSMHLACSGIIYDIINHVLCSVQYTSN